MLPGSLVCISPEAITNSYPRLNPDPRRSLLELSLDGNPVADQNGFGSSYRRYVLHHLPSLHHLDLKRVTDHDHNQPRAFSQAQHPHSGSNASKPTPTTAASAPGVRENNRDRVGSGGGGGGGNNGSGSARSGARGLSESGRPGATKHFGRPSTTDVTHVGNNSNVNNATNNTNKSSSNNSSDTSTSSRVQEQQHQRWASAKKDSNGRSSEGQSALCRTGVEATISESEGNLKLAKLWGLPRCWSDARNVPHIL